MAFSEEQWALLASQLARGFAAGDPFESQDDLVYRSLLDGVVEPEAALRAVRELVAKGTVFRPKPGEIVERCRRDRTTPTFDEMFTLLFCANPSVLRPRVGPGTWPDAASKQREEDAAAWSRIQELHPLIGRFCAQQGLERLRTIQVNDPDSGHWRRDELRASWADLIDAFEDREVAAIALGTGREGIRQLDPLAALGLDGPPAKRVPALPEGQRQHA